MGEPRSRGPVGVEKVGEEEREVRERTQKGRPTASSYWSYVYGGDLSHWSRFVG